MSKSKQQKRFKKNQRKKSEFHNIEKVKKYFLHVANNAKSLSRSLQELLRFDLADKMSSDMYYEIFDLETRGDQFRIEIKAGNYGTDIEFYVDGRLVKEDDALYNFSEQDFDIPSASDIVSFMPSKYLDVSFRGNPSSSQGAGALLIAGMIGYGIAKMK